jgi:hypothetical protein
MALASEAFLDEAQKLKLLPVAREYDKLAGAAAARDAPQQE